MSSTIDQILYAQSNRPLFLPKQTIPYPIQHYHSLPNPTLPNRRGIHRHFLFSKCSIRALLLFRRGGFGKYQSGFQPIRALFQFIKWFPKGLYCDPELYRGSIFQECQVVCASKSIPKFPILVHSDGVSSWFPIPRPVFGGWRLAEDFSFRLLTRIRKVLKNLLLFYFQKHIL